MSRRGMVIRLFGAAVLTGALYVIRPGIVENGVRSPRVLGLTVVVGALAVGLGYLTERRTHSVALGYTASAVPVALTFLLFVLPAFRSTTLIEDFPTFAAGDAIEQTSASPDATVTKTAALATGPATKPSRSASRAQPQPQRITTGTVEGDGHSASGRASVYRLADGSVVLRFEDVDIEGAPDPQVWLVPGSDKSSPGGGTKLGDLKANKGSFGYAVPAGWDVGREFTVVVWCGQFATPIAHATQHRA